ncbi:TPR-like protein [Zopfia rhizophila CBS 207.26]|uniref:TPR-like protein n=1 Tax=Zopfia rhizophila CBS 207.26 TaxID=1314779 RepID=A0A6A6E552_9PEZI|nr:TPR-like protein [Zopfia rhizophila CBS 207.26]
MLSKRGNDSRSMALVDYLPNSYTGSIVFTTRTRKAAISLAKNNIIQVNKMSRDNVMEVLRKTLLQTDLLSDESTVTRFLDILDYLPLAIIQAVSYINKNNISIAEYIELCESSEEDIIEVLSEDFEDEGRYKDMKNPVVATWLISFIQICWQDKLAGEYLSFMACLVRQNIPRSLLPVAPSKKRAIDVIGTLTAYSFITKHKSDDLFDMHRLVHMAMRNWLKQENKWRSWNQKALQQMNVIFPWPRHENRAVWMKYLPHAQTIITSIDLLGGVELPSTLLYNLAECSRITGNYSKAEQLFRQTLQLLENVLGKEHPDTLMSMTGLAISLRQQGKFAEAEAMDRQTLQLKEKVLGKEHPDTLMGMTGLASSLRQQGKFAEAEAMDRQALQLKEKVLGKEHPNTLMDMTGLASSLRQQGKFAEAEAMDRQALQLKEKVLGKKHPNTLMSMNNVAVSLQQQGKFAEAEAMDRQTLQLKKKVLGKEHPDTLMSMNNVAVSLRQQGKFAEAEAMDRQTLQFREKMLGKEHPDTLMTMNNVAVSLRQQGKFAEAEAMYRQTLQLKEKVLGKEHPDTLMSMNNVAVSFRQQGKFAEAEAMDRQTLQLREQPDTPGSKKRNREHKVPQRQRKSARIKG